MLKIFEKFFNKEDKVVEENKAVENNQEKLIEIINETLNGVENSFFIKPKHWSEDDLYKCSWEKFKEVVSDLEEKWLDIDFLAWKYVIWKTVKTSKSTVHMILKQFKFEEIKKED